MPAVSQAQRGYLFATKGADWVKAHHFDNPGKLPQHVNGFKSYAKKSKLGAKTIASMAKKPKGTSLRNS